MKCSLFFIGFSLWGKNISGSSSKLNCAARVGSGQTILGTGRVRASILSPCRPLDVRSVIRFQNHRHCYSKYTVTHLKHFNMSIMSEVQSFVNKINNWLAGKCYIATMLFDSCRAHTFKSSHMRLCVLFFRMVMN